MDKKNLPGLLFFLVFLLGFSLGAKSQPTLSAFTDIGSNYASDGLFLKAAALGSYCFNKTEIKAACQFDVISKNQNILTGSKIILERQLSIREFPFDLQGFFLYKRSSEIIYECDYGLLLEKKTDHFVFNLGTSFRTYGYTKWATSEFDIASKNKIHENWNLNYLIRYNLKPLDYKWNVGVSLTNTDYFVIEQFNNPMFSLHGNYQVSSPVTLFAEAWYKSSGAFNLSVNYFGFFFRTGIIWHITY